MRVVIRLSAKQEAKALPIILRHSPGMILKNRTYILSDECVQLLRERGIKFTEMSRESEFAVATGELQGERI